MLAGAPARVEEEKKTKKTKTKNIFLIKKRMLHAKTYLNLKMLIKPYYISWDLVKNLQVDKCLQAF